MWKKFLQKQSFNEKDLAFIMKNKFFAPKELLERLGLSQGAKPEEKVAIETPISEEAPVEVEDKPKRTRSRKN